MHPRNRDDLLGFLRGNDDVLPVCVERKTIGTRKCDFACHDALSFCLRFAPLFIVQYTACRYQSKVIKYLFPYHFISCAIIYLRKYIALAPGRKGNFVPNPDVQILELFRQLTQDQKQACLDFAQLLCEGVQVETPSVQYSSDPQDP